MSAACRPALTEEQVVAMHAGYLTTPLKVDEYARRFGLSRGQMYKWFGRFGLPSGRYGQRPRSKGQCPAAPSHEFCPFCPCPPPPCAEGHGGEGRGSEWDCGRCSLRRRCACWNARQRRACGFEGAFAEWKAERDKRSRIVKRMRRAAREFQSGAPGLRNWPGRGTTGMAGHDAEDWELA